MYSKHIVLLVAAVTSVLGVPVAHLETRQSCSALQLVHLSGTSEKGLGSVGTPLSAALASAIPGTTTYSVPYDTQLEYIVTVEQGANMTAQYLTAQAARCPRQKFVLSGYSKGALVVHKTTLSSIIQAKVFAILVFGDPQRNLFPPWPINSPSVDSSPRDGSTSVQNIASFCNKDDLFCDIGGTSLDAHVAYPTDGSINVAAAFVKAKV